MQQNLKVRELLNEDSFTDSNQIFKKNEHCQSKLIFHVKTLQSRSVNVLIGKQRLQLIALKTLIKKTLIKIKVLYRINS